MKEYIVQISIPVYSQYTNDVYYHELHFKTSPSKDEVISKVKELHSLDSIYVEYDNSWLDVLTSVEQVKDWAYVEKGGLMGTNTFVDVPIFGKAAFYWHVLEVY